MTQVFDRPLDFIPLNRGRLSRKIFSHTVRGAAILALSALVGALMLYTRPDPAPNAAKAPAAAPVAEAAAATPPANVASNAYGALFDPGFSSGSPPVLLSQSFPLQSDLGSVAPAQSAAIAEPDDVMPTPPAADLQIGESAPLPAPRPAELGAPASRGPIRVPGIAGRQLAQQNRRNASPSASSDNRNFFEKLFGMPQTPRTVLAYAAPEDDVVSDAPKVTTGTLPRYDRWTAIYDVAAHTVYMPNGTRLEAHSGLGDRLDDPHYVHERNRGATPPNVYELTPREQLFHGVQALRLKPVGGGDVYGRTGLLAHTYMLGPRGDSNGCVSFRNYNAFLQAFQNGEVRRLVVVARLN
ncbi:conserved protein of unknown function [Methylocella tundrae]|uniref:Tlde1 domain-containing protein n=2 Tax=Methylocella tundrae TaxID=227605 RepID=A0A4U8Z5L4_METTU|nr:conserved protein of unknown function [Methylocella tundrae]